MVVCEEAALGRNDKRRQVQVANGDNIIPRMECLDVLGAPERRLPAIRMDLGG